MMSAEQPAPSSLDRAPLTHDGVREILARRFDDLREVPIRSLGHGWDFDAWLADEHWLFRFPRRSTCVQWQARETALLQSIQGQLPLPVPCPTRFGQAGDDFPYDFAGYEFLEGMGGDLVLPATHNLPAFAKRMGAFLGALQHVKTTAIEGGALSKDAVPFDQLVSQSAEFMPELEVVLSPDSLRWARQVLGDDVPAPEPHEGETVLTHSDLFLEHMLFEPATGSLVGVIDWADAGWGDPIGDFTPFWILFGETFFQNMLAASGRTFRKGAQERARRCGAISLLRWIGESQRWGGQGTRLATWANAVFVPRLLAGVRGTRP